MDVTTIIASVGSFAISERVLKPKATVLVILGCLLAYDLRTKTHDVSSLRVYRGPALLAFTLMMAAYSLRTWRRNGVACDELIFLPGTAHGQRHGIEHASSGPQRNSPPSPQHRRSEGDVAAGVGFVLQPDAGVAEAIEMMPNRKDRVDILQQPVLRGSPSRSLSRESSLSSIQEFANSWEENDDEDDEQDDACADDLTVPLNNREVAVAAAADGLGAENTTGALRSRTRSTGSIGEIGENAVRRFRENHPRITRIGSFFFFRSSTSSTSNASYAPSGPMVLGAALDRSMPILFNFHLFIEASNHITSYGSETPAKILPLIFLSVLIVRSMIPPGRRGRFWSVVRFTVAAPFHPVNFRDAYIGDILTSLVRPLQDVLFALSYYLTVINGMISGEYGLSKCASMLESSWVLHNLVLPSAAILPLWWKFLQTLRQSYDTGERWPFLGNAFKYLSASVVIIYGMTHPEDRRSIWWVVSFVLCVLYQVWWDTIMEWDLFKVVPRDIEPVDSDSSWDWISSHRPNSYFLGIQMTLFRPIKGFVRSVCSKIPSFDRLQLRPIRLYKDDSFYWKIFLFNGALRFTWMLCYIPAYRLSGSEHVTTFSSDTNSYIGVLLPAAELLRRTFWGFLHLERETIRLNESNPQYTRALSQSSANLDTMLEEMTEMSEDTLDSSKMRHLPIWFQSHQPLPQDPSGSITRPWIHLSDETKRKIFVGELAAWACAFVGFGMWAAG